MTPLQPGRYIVAVSGGVDSMCLLDALAARPELEIIVAHFDHGQRADSVRDATLVETAAGNYGRPFITGKAPADIRPDENSLRQARYQFLREVMQQTQALAIITAHHQDDLLETIVMKLLRGTNRRGLSPMQATPDIIRPLLGVTKAYIYEYARQHELKWHEDSSNTDTKYLRNHVRHVIMPRLSVGQRTELLRINQKMTILNRTIDDILNERLAAGINRGQFASWPYLVSREYLAGWLRQSQVGDVTSRALDRLTVAAKTLSPGHKVDVLGGVSLHITKQSLALEASERYNKETYG